MIAMFSGALAVGTATSAGGMGSGTTNQWTSFNKLDQNGDGRISQQEADAHPILAEHFKRLDNNENGQLEQGEFAQCETMHGMEQPDKGRGSGLHESEH